MRNKMISWLLNLSSIARLRCAQAMLTSPKFRGGILGAALCFIALTDVHAQTLTAKVNRSVVPQGETFVYLLDLRGDVDGEPDLGALGKDFQVYSADQSVRDFNINGAVTNTRQWQVALGALQKGEFVIPAIKLGNLQSNEVKVKVVDSEVNATSKKTEAFISKVDTVTSNSRPFVQQQINYTIILTDSRPIQIEGIQLMDDGSNAWIIKELKPADVEVGEVDGKKVRVFKFYLALFPQSSGFIKTPEFRILGYYLTKPQMFGRQRGFDDMFMQKNPITLATKQVDIEVRPVREKNTWWLPAKQVEIASEFEPSNPTFKVGEAVNRTVKIAARGVLENQLPEITFAQIEGMKQYPSKPSVEQTLRGDDVVAIKSVSNVYIPTREGEMELPSITVDWFNVDDLKQETTVLPAVKIMVEKGDIAGGSDETVNTPSVAPSPIIVKNDSQSSASQEINPVSFGQDSYVIAFIAFVLGVLAAYVMLRPHDKKTNHKRLAMRALRDKDYKVARDEILLWAREFYGSSRLHNLNDVGRVAGSAELARLLNELENSLYAGKVVGFDGKDLVAALEKVGKSKAGRKGKEPLPKLYE